MAFAVLLLLVANAVIYNHARAMLHFASDGERTPKPEELRGFQKLKTLLLGIRLPRPENSAAPDAVGLGYEQVAIKSADGISLGVWHCPAIHAKCVVLLFHGYGSEKSSLLAAAKAIHELGAATMLVDFRGSGQSSGSLTTVGYREADDVEAVFRFAKTSYPGLPVVLYGESMGAAAVLRAVMENGIKPEGIMAVSVFDRLVQTVGNRFKAMHLPAFPFAHALVFWAGVDLGVDAFRHNPVEYARRVSCPILFLHGEIDPRATLDEGKNVFNAVSGSSKTLVVFPGEGHVSLIAHDGRKWRDAVADLLHRACSQIKDGNG